MRGKFITIYGINNIGKSTHAKLLIERLIKEGYKAKFIKYPVYDIEPTGPFLNSVLRNPNGQKNSVGENISEDELQLWFVMNRYQYQPELKRLLNEGYIVVAEDYVGTGIAWGMAKGLDEEWLKSANKYLLKEDFAIVLEGERDLTVQEKIHVHEQNDELVKKCLKTLQYLTSKYNWHRIQIQSKIENTAEILWNTVNEFLEKK